MKWVLSGLGKITDFLQNANPLIVFYFRAVFYLRQQGLKRRLMASISDAISSIGLLVTVTTGHFCRANIFSA
jgi:hypothetical protein